MVGYDKAYQEKEVWASGGTFQDIASNNVSGTTVSAGTGTFTTGAITTVNHTTCSGATVKANNVVVAGSIDKTVGAGSPVEWNYMVQAGSSALSSNTKWVSYPTAFGGVPIVTVTNLTAVGGALDVSDIGNIGSFQASGANASDKFMWVAVGQRA